MTTLRIWDSGLEEDDVSGARAVVDKCRTEVERHVTGAGGTVDVENHGIQAGDHITHVYELGWSVVSGVVTAAVLGIAKSIRHWLSEARRAQASAGVVLANEEVLLLLVYAAIKERSPGFRTDPELVQTLRDGARRYNRESPNNEHYQGFPVGNYLFRVPDLDRRETHIVEIHSSGEIVDHRVRPELTADAEDYLDGDDQ